MNKNFAIFILTHGRAEKVITTKTLINSGYNGKIFYIVDNEDNQQYKYIEIFGKENVKIFNKKKYADLIDEGNNFDERRTITHARNACFDIAKELGITYFMQLDDDYTSFQHRYISKCGTKLKVIQIKNMDYVISKLLDFYKSINCKSIAFAQGGDFIGGVDNGKEIFRFQKRKCMNSFICSIERPFNFIGAMNEDVNTYTTLGSRGELFFTIPYIMLVQKQTQSQEGGITDMYKLYGTYCKSFTTVMMMPSSVKISEMGNKNKRLHHKINWNNTVPKIISEELKK
jgi:hypothetical protein